MPVSIPYTFTQTDDALTIVAEVLAGSGAVSKATAHLLVTPVLVKLNVAPSSLMALDLAAEVDPDRVSMLIDGQRVTITLSKAASARGPWPQLLADGLMDKVTRLQRRQASLVAHEAREAEKAASRVADKKAAESANRETSWAHDRAVASAAKQQADLMKAQAIESIEELRRNIEENRRKEKAAADREAAAATAAAAPTTEQSLESSVPELDDGDDAAAAAPASRSKPARDASIWDAEEGEGATSASASAASATSAPASSARPAAAAAVSAPPAVLAPVRRTNAAVSITFTKDATATPSLPARESTMAQKMAYKATMLAADPEAAAAAAAAAASSGDDARDARESSPLLLKEKGDKLLKDGDTLGAIAAYTASIEKDTKRAIAAGSGSASSATSIDPMCLVRAYSNRAAAHLKLASSRADVAAIAESRNRLRSCIADCATVLRILDEGRAATANPSPALMLEMYALSLKALHRQASAYSWLGAYARACTELRSLLTMLGEAQSFRAKSVQREEEERASEHKESDPTPLPSASASAVSLPTLPALDPAKLQQELTLFESLLAALEAKQHEAYKAEGDRLLAVQAGESQAAKALEAYSSALLVHPAHLGALSNRSAAQLAARRWAECVQDATLALALWEELWISPKTGLAAVAPAPASADIVAGPLPSDAAFAKPTARLATAAAIHARVRLVVRRATARAGLHAWMAAQADLQHALALLPLTGSSAAPVAPASLAALKLDLDFLSWRLGLGARTRKAAAALGAAEHAKSVALYTDAIEFHAKWTVAEEAACGAAEKAAASVTSIQGTLAAVTPALAHVSLLGSLLSDRSCAHLGAKSYAAAIQGCSVAMQVWSNLSSAGAASAVVPSWTTVTLVRRGSARAFQGDLAGGADDYEKALAQWAQQTPLQEQEANAGSATAAANKEQRAQREQVALDLQRIRAAAAAMASDRAIS